MEVSVVGCDIHPFVEYHLYGGGDWWSFSAGDLECGRNYRLFGFLADVRGDGPPVAEPRGIPDDASWQVMDCWEKHGEHTPSWLSLEECERVSKLMEEDPEYGPPVEWPIIVSIMRQLQEATGRPSRLVFWFDS